MSGGGSRSVYDAVNSSSSNFHHSTSPNLQSASTSRRQSSFSKSNNTVTSPTDVTPRYPLQLKALKDMGFHDEAANIAAINSTAGNLPQAIDKLLSQRTSNMSLSSSPTLPTTKASDDLVDVFAVISPPPTTSHKANTAAETSQTAPVMSILDLDPQQTALMTEESKKGEEEDNEVEFNDFESAPSPSSRRPSSASAFVSASHHETTTPQKLEELPTYISRNNSNITSSVAQMVSNPWSSLNEEDGDGRAAVGGSRGTGSSGNVFDEIDPFRGFVAHNK